MQIIRRTLWIEALFVVGDMHSVMIALDALVVLTLALELLFFFVGGLVVHLMMLISVKVFVLIVCS